MTVTRSFRTRLLLSFLLVIILAMLLPAWYARRVLDREIAEEVGAGVVRRLDLVQLMLEEESADRPRQARHAPVHHSAHATSTGWKSSRIPRARSVSRPKALGWGMNCETLPGNTTTKKAATIQPM